MRFFGLKTCDSCRKSLKILAAGGIAPQVIDVRADGVAKADLVEIAAQFGAGAVNRTSATWRTLSAEDRSLPVAALLAAHPTVMKRPVIEADGRWYIGWNADVQAALLR